jgi:hypothetical protein
MVGVRARRKDSIASGRQASKRDAPNASSVSVLSRFSLQYSLESTTRSVVNKTSHSSSFRIKLSDTKTPAIAGPHSIPTTGTELSLSVSLRIKPRKEKGTGKRESVLTELSR